ncbi:hypothetical protein LAZ40_04290 [Cereibacter sphaeroides]|uniref:hypothetical protein n=1 Tax=Cereibacter sphaeroides TaxID=1063 RepID=UPI001F15EBE2|nr:hypothetical protein [Cereibacter sphaeroides]MCE6958274.1 hypothetical protein [Cereibacter sphaeroides]MCE6971337.1 hypothetical protein [Cereibacter sphaeroides]
MSDTTIRDAHGRVTFKIRRAAGSDFHLAREGFARLDLGRDGDDPHLSNMKTRAMLNRPLLAQRPKVSRLPLPVETSPDDLEMSRILRSEPELRLGTRAIAVSGGTREWTAEAIFQDQPHAAWMRLVDGHLQSRRGNAWRAMRDYWRILCLERPDLSPDGSDGVEVKLPRRGSGSPVLVVDDVLVHCLHLPLREMISSTLNQGFRGFVSVGPDGGGDGGRDAARLTLVAFDLVAAPLLAEHVGSRDRDPACAG